jgi:hypothetical protein
MFRLLMILLLGAALLTLHASVAEEGGSPVSRHGPLASLGGVPGSVAVSTHTAIIVHERTRLAAGRGISAVIRPVVTGIAEGNRADLAELEPALRRARGPRQQRAREIQRLVIQTDSIAFVRLEHGHPLAAMRAAMKSRSLVDAVRHQVAEEIIR